jgi:hypothetical protein
VVEITVLRKPIASPVPAILRGPIYPGLLELQEAVDVLQADAERTGLIDDIGRMPCSA